MADPLKMKVEVEVPSSPELLASMFANMGSDQQAKTLSMMWSSLRGACGSAGMAAVQCAYIRQEAAFDDEAKSFLRNLIDEDEQPKTYTIERAHPDGSVSITSGLSADEVMAAYLNGDELEVSGNMEPAEPRCDRSLAQAAIPDSDEQILRALGKMRRLATAYKGADKFRSAAAEMAALDEQRIRYRIERELGKIVAMEWKVPTVNMIDGYSGLGGRPKGVVMRIRPRKQPHGFTMNPYVSLGGLPLGRVTEVHDDGTVSILITGDGGFYADSVEDGVPQPCGHIEENPCREIKVPAWDTFRGQWNRATKTSTCPDCNGSGEYQGFTAVEPCRRCGGKGEL